MCPKDGNGAMGAAMGSYVSSEAGMAEMMFAVYNGGCGRLGYGGVDGGM